MSIEGRQAPPLRYKGADHGGDLIHHEFEAVGTRNGVPPSKPYVRRAVPDEPWRVELAMIRQRAAVRCGLAEYPGELIRLTERLDRMGSICPPRMLRWLLTRQAELQAGVRKLSPKVTP